MASHPSWTAFVVLEPLSKMLIRPYYLKLKQRNHYPVLMNLKRPGTSLLGYVKTDMLKRKTSFSAYSQKGPIRVFVKSVAPIVLLNMSTPMDKIYYYISSDGVYHFSTGVEREGDKAEQYLRMLRFAKRRTISLRIEDTKDKETIQKIFREHL